MRPTGGEDGAAVHRAAGLAGARSDGGRRVRLFCGAEPTARRTDLDECITRSDSAIQRTDDNLHDRVARRAVIDDDGDRRPHLRRGATHNLHGQPAPSGLGESLADHDAHHVHHRNHLADLAEYLAPPDVHHHDPPAGVDEYDDVDRPAVIHHHDHGPGAKGVATGRPPPPQRHEQRLGVLRVARHDLLRPG